MPYEEEKASHGIKAVVQKLGFKNVFNMKRITQQEAKQYVAAAGGLAALGANGEYRVRGAQYTLVFVTAAQYAECFGGLTCVGGQRSSFFGAIALQTASLAPLRQALERLQKNGLHTITWSEQRGRLAVQIPGFNTLLEFVDADIA